MKKSKINLLNWMQPSLKVIYFIKKLKSKIAVHNDKFRNEMIKLSGNILLSGLLKGFNKIFKAVELHEMWTEGLISSIHKSEKSLDPNNYRGISRVIWAVILLNPKYSIDEFHKKINTFYHKLDLCLEEGEQTTNLH